MVVINNVPPVNIKYNGNQILLFIKPIIKVIIIIVINDDIVI